MWLAAAVLAVSLGLISQSPFRHVGDAGEYTAMAVNLARFSRPSLTPAQLADAATRLPEGAAANLVQPERLAADGRQDFAHFWFYPLLAAPFVHVAMTLGLDPQAGFVALNLGLIVGLTVLFASRIAPAGVLLVVFSPIIWWLDKPHTEVFTFTLVATALVLLREKPWWSIVAFGAAATQNPPIAGAMAIALVVGLIQHGFAERRLWFAGVAGALLAGLHPAYYYSRLGVWSGLTGGIDRHWPAMREVTTVPFDSNVGVFVLAPLLSVTMIAALVAVLRRPQHRRMDIATGAMLLIAVLFLLSFTQTTNYNSGGTPGPSRYGMWLVPFLAPMIGWVDSRARWLWSLAVASSLWSVWAFAPARPERYVEPSALASYLWSHAPDIDNPVAEVFVERLGGSEFTRPPVATSGCEKVLLVGNGSSAIWPQRCTSADLPDFCRSNGALCYANRTSSGYRFAKALGTPAWRSKIARPLADRFSQGGELTVTHAGSHRPQVALWHDSGWSYLETHPNPGPDDVFRAWRWIDERADLGVTAAEPITVRLEFVARAFNKARRLKVTTAGREVLTVLVPVTISAFTSPEFTLPAGRSMVTFESLDGAESPNSTDPRRLSVQVYRIELVVR
jgi:hypothetical protein